MQLFIQVAFTETRKKLNKLCNLEAKAVNSRVEVLAA
jgi:hypothetical protein